MTPLSNALRRLAESSLQAEASHRENPRAAANDQADEPTTLEASWVELSGVATRATVEDTSDENTQDESTSGDDTPNNGEERSPQPASVDPWLGIVTLFCDVSGDDNLAFLAAANDSDLVVHLRDDADRDAAPSLGLFDDALRDAARVRWPDRCRARYLEGQEGAARVVLAFDSPDFSPREWVLFLDDCRQAYKATTLVAPAGMRPAVEWLAGRCDAVRLVVERGVAEAGLLGRTAERIRRATPRPFACLLLEAA